jgi:transposase InsO family protein
MDFAFVRGSKYIHKDDQGTTITSLDGYQCYLSIKDRKTRYQWVFPTKSKTPPLDIIDTFLTQHGHKTATRKTIRLDQGGDLYESHKFKEIALKHNFNLEPTGAGAPFQNGMVERVNQTLENMMRCLLLSANLGPEYWSFALTHAVYLKNRLPHTATGETPHLSYTGHKPNAKHLRIFGSPVFVKNPGRRPCKLDLHTATGKFLGCTATEKYIIYIDDTTKRIKIP